MNQFVGYSPYIAKKVSIAPIATQVNDFASSSSSSSSSSAVAASAAAVVSLVDPHVAPTGGFGASAPTARPPTPTQLKTGRKHARGTTVSDQTQAADTVEQDELVVVMQVHTAPKHP